MTQRFSIATVAVLLGAGCASTNTPASPNPESSSAAIRAAEEVGATHDATAALHLQLAKEQFEHASKLSAKKDKPRADRLLMRAEADAELALALARSEAEKAEALGAINKAKKLKESATR
jgi:hypothetical protein